MAETTAIAWADATFNPWIGCHDISPGCAHCYAEAYAKRVGRDFAQRTRTSAAYWRQPLKWEKKARESGRPFRVFSASLADIFDNEAPQPWRLDLFDLIEETPHLTWMLLTKRVGNVMRMLKTHDWCAGRKNVWLGATVVTQAEADRDIPKLLSIKAHARFVSIEPQLELIDLTRWLVGIDMVIVGGESGHHARRFDSAWARSLRAQCRVTGTAFFMKQMGSAAGLRDRAGADPSEWPEDLRVQQFPTDSMASAGALSGQQKESSG
jgi:protein gp37